MAVAVALQWTDNTRRRQVKEYKFTFSGSYTTGGETIDFTLATNPNKLAGAPWGRIPNGFSIENFPAGFGAEILPGTTLKNWKIKIWDNANNGQLAAAGYPAAISGDTGIRALFDGPAGV